jgi:glycosyltransferase involved in cell wall biosynthesis
MKVLIVHNRYQSRHIGGEDLIVDRELRELKNAVGENNVFEYMVSNDAIEPKKLMITLWGDHNHYQNIFNLVTTHQIDIVHVHNFFPLLTPTVFSAAKAAGAKVVHTLHNFRWWCVGGNFYREGQGACEACVDQKIRLPAIQHQCYRGSYAQSAASAAAFSWYQLRKYQSKIDAYFVLTDFQRKKVSAWLPEEALWIKPNGIDLPSVTMPIDAKRDYLYVGRLEAGKGIDYLLSVWESLPEYFVLNIIGSGEDDTLEKKYASNNIRFLGKLSHESTLKKMSESKYLIHPSLNYETFGLTLVEALAQGTPVIAFDIGPRREFIQNGSNGWLCEKAQLKNAIIHSFEEEHYDLFSARAKESVKRFEAKYVMSQQLKWYEKICSEEKAGDYLDRYSLL